MSTLEEAMRLLAQSMMQQQQQQAAQQQQMMELLGRVLSPKGAGKGMASSPAAAAVSEPKFAGMDVRGVGKPQELTEKDARDKEKFRQWRTKLDTWYSDQWSGATEIFQRMLVKQAEVLTEDKLEDLELNFPGTEALSASLRSVLIHLCQGEAFTVATVGVAQNKAAGLESYRRLSRRFDPQGGDLELAQLRKILKFEEVPVDKLRSNIEQMEEQARLWDLRNPQDKIPTFILRLVLNDKLVEPLRTHIDLRLGALKTYEQLREEIFAYLNVVETQSAKKTAKTTTQGGDAMDVDQVDWLQDNEYLDEDEKEYLIAALSKAKGKGKGKGKSLVKRCHGCESTTHLAKDCWVLHPHLKEAYNKARVARGKGDGKEGGKGRGKGSGTRAMQELEEQWEGDAEGEESLEPEDVQIVDICYFDISPVEVLSCSTNEQENKKKSTWYRNLGEYTLILFGIDSCAAASACPFGVAPLLELKKSATAGVRRFRAAGGQILEDYGDRRITGVTEDGFALAMTMAVTDVGKPLLAVSSLEDKGCQVVLGGAEGSYLQLPAGGAKVPLYRHNGIYVLPVYVDNKTTGGVSWSKGSDVKASLFHWQVA
jgi:hypothetical protein